MSEERIQEIKLACLNHAIENCASHPEDALKVAKEYFEWIMATTD
jgi:hypothetical protein